MLPLRSRFVPLSLQMLGPIPLPACSPLNDHLLKYLTLSHHRKLGRQVSGFIFMGFKAVRHTVCLWSPGSCQQYDHVNGKRDKQKWAAYLCKVCEGSQCHNCYLTWVLIYFLYQKIRCKCINCLCLGWRRICVSKSIATMHKVCNALLCSSLSPTHKDRLWHFQNFQRFHEFHPRSSAFLYVWLISKLTSKNQQNKSPWGL